MVIIITFQNLTFRAMCILMPTLSAKKNPNAFFRINLIHIMCLSFGLLIRIKKGWHLKYTHCPLSN